MADDKEKRLKLLQAVALEYNPDDVAPKIVATGRGKVAEKIIEAANAAAVPVHQDTKLANTLSKLDIGDYIPPELYEVVAEILVFVDDMEKLKGKL
ncbi:MAG: EscU/YscU/HrcU family type III secretion system export apparatus switch protein [Lachnospiraceae bacterium]|nr:EscU/YscU/HrcU family type III secretion system export apparatus switch protein [Lachnospiraceae bacterium]